MAAFHLDREGLLCQVLLDETDKDHPFAASHLLEIEMTGIVVVLLRDALRITDSRTGGMDGGDQLVDRVAGVEVLRKSKAVACHLARQRHEDAHHRYSRVEDRHLHLFG